MGESEQTDRPSERHHEGPPILLEGRVSDLEARHGEQQEEERKYKNRQLWFNFLLVLVGAATVGVYAYQAHIMVRALEATKISADAAKLAADSAAQSFDITRRLTEGNNEAFCDVRGDLSPDENVIHIGVNNRGKINAVHVSAHIEITRNSMPSIESLALLKTIDINEDDIQANNGVSRDVEINLSRRDRERIWQRLETVVINARLQYDNGFGNIRLRSFCTVYVGGGPETAGPNNPAHLVECYDLPRFLKSLATTQKQK